MKYISLIYFFMLLTPFIEAEDLDLLLDGYKKEADLSKITKVDTAGILQLFTRDDLEKMQVHNLTDILNTIPGVYLKRGMNNLALLARPAIYSAPLTLTRLYINDHDMTSSSFGSAFMILGELPIEYIDHIEVYKATSSLDFGNENAALIIRLYTKTAQRDSGTKTRIILDDKGSYNLNLYTTNILDNDLEYFTYASIDDISRDVYHQIYNNDTYDFKSEKRGYNFFANLNYNDYKVDIGGYKKINDNFIGIGSSLHKTPTGGEFDTEYKYIHLTKQFENGLKFQLSYDDLEYERIYRDKNGIVVSNLPLINNYKLIFNDDIFSLILEKKLTTNNNELLIGGFYKKKSYRSNGAFCDNNQSFLYSNQSSNSLNLYSFYVEDNYKINNSTLLMSSIKLDIFHYDKDVKRQHELIARIGIIKALNNFKFKLFYAQSYLPLAFYQVYNPDNIPYKSNTQLNTQKIGIYTATVEHKTNNQRIAFNLIYRRNKDLVKYVPSTENGWINTSKKIFISMYSLDYSYNFNLNNKLDISATYGKNSLDLKQTPTFEIMTRSFNKYKKFDFYNALIYRTSYTYLDMHVSNSYDLTSSIKYHYNEDTSFGIRGENILGRGYEQVYSGIDYSIPVIDQKIWLNMEYIF